MKSRLLSIANYTGLMELPIREEIPLSELNGDVENELKELCLGCKYVEHVDTVSPGDAVTLTLKSQAKKYNRTGLQLAVGTNLFSKELEETLSGKKVGTLYDTTVENIPVTVHIDDCQRTVIPPLSHALVCAQNIPHVTTVEAYKRYILEKYKALYEKYYLEYYAAALGDLWLEKSVFELEEQEVQQWHDAIVQCQEEEQAFHDFVRLENYEGEVEEENRQLTQRYIKGALMYAFLRGVDPGTFAPEYTDLMSLNDLFQKVLEPLTAYLAGHFFIDWKEA